MRKGGQKWPEELLSYYEIKLRIYSSLLTGSLGIKDKGS